ncbi:MAG: hypothetical protein ACK5H4_21425 [Lacrimispora sphenoides]
MKIRDFKTAPLPFQGQKRFFVPQYEKALKEINEKQKITLIVDLFGGSGLLSHVAKRTLPDCQVIYNDFDGYTRRLRNIPRTNLLLNDIRELVTTEREKRILPEIKDKVINRIRAEEKTGFVDYITISTSLLFSANYVLNINELTKATLYNNIKQTEYLDCANEYLNGLDVLKQDYYLLFERYKNYPGVLFTIDPPYLSTDTTTYNSDKYWRLGDYLNVLRLLKDTNYVFFTSNKSSLIELCEWFTNNYNLHNPFHKAKTVRRKNTLTPNGSYTDIMIYKNKE